MEPAIKRLMSIYWKISSLVGISILLLTDERPIGFITMFISQVFIFISIWFWVDLNEEIADLPQNRALPLTTKIWRWGISIYTILASAITLISLPCIQNTNAANCQPWLEAPTNMHGIAQQVFSFLFGADWNQPLAGFIGYLFLIIYGIGLLQWILVRLPKQGRIAGDF